MFVFIWVKKVWLSPGFMFLHECKIKKQIILALCWHGMTRWGFARVSVLTRQQDECFFHGLCCYEMARWICLKWWMEWYNGFVPGWVLLWDGKMGLPQWRGGWLGGIVPGFCLVMRWQDGFSSVDTCFKCDIAPSMTTLSPGGGWWQGRWWRCSTRWGSVWKGRERVLGHHQFREEEDAWPNSGLWEVWHWQGKHLCSYGVWWSVLLHSMSSYIIRGVGIAQ